MKIHIVRHGDPDYLIDSLTEKGWREATLLAERIAKIPVDDFYCSPLGRAKDTASLTLKKCNREAKTLDWLHEFRGKIVSPFTGEERRSWDMPPYTWGLDEKSYDINRWSEIEIYKNTNVNEIYKETAEGVDNLLALYGMKREGRLYRNDSDKTIVLFCHFVIGITVLSHLAGISPAVAHHNFFLAPTSVTTLVTETDSRGYSHFRATEIGDTSHLYAGGEPVSESGLYPIYEV